MRLKQSSRMGSKYIFKTFKIEIPELRKAIQEGYKKEGDLDAYMRERMRKLFLTFDIETGTAKITLHRLKTGVDVLLHKGRRRLK